MYLLGIYAQSDLSISFCSQEDRTGIRVAALVLASRSADSLTSSGRSLWGWQTSRMPLSGRAADSGEDSKDQLFEAPEVCLVHIWATV